MEIQNNAAQAIAPVQPVTPAAPPPAEADGRPAADAAAMKTDATPEVPLPMPASPQQAALVSKVAITDTESDAASKTPGVSEAERMLKPYGINMLPEKQDARPEQSDPATELG